MKYNIDGLLYWAPTPKLGGGWVLHKDSPEPPAAPDPKVVSAEQTKSNVDTARVNAALNRVNQVTPYGSLTYSQNRKEAFDQAGYDKALAEYNAKPTWREGTQGELLGYEGEGENRQPIYSQGTQAQALDRGPAPTRDQFTTPGSDEWTANVQLTPQQQALLDQDTRIKQQLGNTAEQGLGRLQSTLGTQLDTSGFTGYRDIPTGGGAERLDYDNSYARGLLGGIQRELPNSDYGAQRKSVEDAIYSRVNPQLERDRAALDQRLANQGIMPGSEAYREAVDESNRAANDARMQAVLAGGQEQSRLAGLDLQSGQFKNQAQNQAFGQDSDLFSRSLSQINQRNGANQQDFSQQIAASQAGNAQRQQQLQEAAFLRSLPMNELNALRTGAQVNNPTFSPTPQVNVANTDPGANIYKSYQGQQQNYSNEVATNNANTQATVAAIAAAASMF